jgi:hypothetical protein
MLSPPRPFFPNRYFVLGSLVLTMMQWCLLGKAERAGRPQVNEYCPALLLVNTSCTQHQVISVGTNSGEGQYYMTWCCMHEAVRDQAMTEVGAPLCCGLGGKGPIYPR